MRCIARPIRIEPAFDDPMFVGEIFERYAPYRTMAEYLPRSSVEQSSLR
jgi:hypothetical protein